MMDEITLAPPSLRASHTHFFCDDQLFIPLVQQMQGSKEGNMVSICLPAWSDHDLDWEEYFKLAADVKMQGKKIFWEIDFGFNRHPISLSDPTAFLSFRVALDHFLNLVKQKKLLDSSFALSFYSGDMAFEEKFIWNETDLFHFKEWQEEDGGSFLLFCTNVFAEYVHRLASHLPDEIFPFCLLDVSALTLGQSAQLLSKERFAHVHLAVKGSLLPLGGLTWEEGNSLGGWIGKGKPIVPLQQEIRTALCLPPDEMLTSAAMQELDSLLLELCKQMPSFRIIAEAQLTEQWDGIDRLIALTLGCSKQGRRKLQGFSAAGGSVDMR